ncbi:tetratricopeptide repeat protein [Flavobacterium cellulosilyticum]|uniref:Tetratricopeptide repeat protein n=1 Tax=Flavobacterium cellulosilyticum TaxID=2541731 RepID=A0A4R5CG36_9FLAO|nr:tetratricopeptide repeat protein [Flavobacterium cellulosilyticum]TDD97966.1 tetratricopeptide repeat protein [Flavobacterium cellulosilyticum]
MNFKILFISLFIILKTSSIYAQNDGYWDKERSFTKENVVSARDRIVVKTDDLPLGTTEVLFRITLLDGNQQMASSLVSVLKSIPDPTGISQGSAGAVFLLSKISGEDKCKYAIFSNETAATEYKKSGNTDKACYVQNEAVSKDAKVLSMEKYSCILSNSNTMWFGFESKNWIMNQKVVIEILPWVNKKLSRGWVLENRKSIINQCKISEIAKKIIEPDDFCICTLDKIQKEYKFQEFQKLLAIEKSKIYKDIGNVCLKGMGVSNTVYPDLRNEASKLMKQGKYGDAIDKILRIVINGMATDIDFNTLGNAYIMTKQYGKAIKFLKEGEKMDDSELLIQMNLAHAYLFNNDFKAAKAIYKKYQSQNVTDSLSWTQKVKQDFETFEKAGLPNDDYKRVLKLF